MLIYYPNSSENTIRSIQWKHIYTGPELYRHINQDHILRPTEGDGTVLKAVQGEFQYLPGGFVHVIPGHLFYIEFYVASHGYAVHRLWKAGYLNKNRYSKKY